jgi:DNA-binding LacI/PurR family transcriptional regulator
MTQSEIAKKLGVSQAAVSYVLRGGGKVSDDLREKVLELAGENSSSLSPGRPAKGVPALFYSGPFNCCGSNPSVFGQVLDSLIQEELVSAGREFRHYADMRLEKLLSTPMRQLKEDVEAKKVSSIIALNLHWDSSYWSWLGKFGVPVIAFDHDFGWGAVSYDFAKAGYDAASLLAAKGCSRVELLSAATREWIDPVYASRLNRPLRAGMANALRNFGLKAPEAWLTPEMLPDALKNEPDLALSVEEQGREMFKLLYETRKPDGLVVYTDVFAVGVLRGIEEAGLVLGKDIHAVLLANKEIEFEGNSRFPRLRLSIREIAASMLKLADDAEKGLPPKELYICFEP